MVTGNSSPFEKIITLDERRKEKMGSGYGKASSGVRSQLGMDGGEMGLKKGLLSVLHAWLPQLRHATPGTGISDPFVFAWTKEGR